MDPIKTAANRLSATQIGSYTWAYRADETGQWYAVDGDTMADLGQRILDGQVDAYSLWCAERAPVLLISGTDHDALDTLCDAGGNAERDYRCQCGTATGVRCEWVGNRSELVHVRWVPESDRGSAKASGTYDMGAYAVSLYVSPDCAEMLTHEFVDGEQTDDLDPYVRVVGPAYASPDADHHGQSVRQ